MYQKAKRMFSFDSERKNTSHSVQKSGRREKTVYTDESEDAPLRPSYVRASNSLRRYNPIPKRTFSTGEGSLGSSREDLLDAPIVYARKKRPLISKQPSREYKSGNSSSEDLLCDESDYTEDPLSTAVVETDGSVFSSQENLFDPPPKCSENVSRFLRRQSTTDSKKRTASESQGSLNNLLVLEGSVQFHQPDDEGKDKLDNCKENVPCKGEKRNHVQPDHQTEISVPPSVAVEGIVTESSLCSIAQPVLSDNIWPIIHRIQVAVTKTIHRLADHIETVKEHVEILEKKCNNLKVTLYYLQEDHEALKVKITKLEELIEQREATQSDESDSDEYLDCLDYISLQSVNGESLPLVEHIYKDSTVGKALSEADTTLTTVNGAQDNRTTTVFTSVSSVAEHISVSHTWVRSEFIGRQVGKGYVTSHDKLSFLVSVFIFLRLFNFCMRFDILEWYLRNYFFPANSYLGK